MSIVYGKYSIPFKRYKSHEVGFEDHFTDDVTIHVVQNCGHLFFIPCFGMGKDYFYRKDRVYHPLPHKLMLRLQEQENIGTPVFAYILPLLLMLTIAGFVGKEIFWGNSRTQSIKNHFESNLAEVEYALAHLSNHHYIKLKNPAEPYGSKPVYLHVKEILNQEIICRVMQTYSSNFDIPYRLAKHFEVNGQALSEVTITKKDLNAAVSKSFARYKKKYRPAIQLLGDGQPYFVESIIYINGPVLEASSTWNPKSPNDLDIFLVNTGFGASLIKVESRDAEIKWSPLLPQYLPGGDSKENHLSIRGSSSNPKSKYSISLILQDSLGSQFTFSVLTTKKSTQVKRIY